ARRVEHKPQLAISRVPRVDGSSLALRVHVPAGGAVDEFLEGLLALHRKARAAATTNIVPLNAGVFPFGGLAAEVNGFSIGLQVRPRQIALGELLAGVAHPPGARSSPG